MPDQNRDMFLAGDEMQRSTKKMGSSAGFHLY
jgi:hypothetical protein